MGGSYGGYATLAGVAFTPDLYAAGVAIVAPSNLLTLLDSIPAYWEAGRKSMYTRMADPGTAEGKAQLARQSPLNSAGKIKSPLMVVQGANDPRVNQAESDQIVIALRDRNFPVEYLVAPDEGHGFQRPVHSIEAVWNLVNPPDLAPLLTPGLALGYRVPGTPSGLGERQAFERLNGTTVILEVIQYEPNRLAVTRQVSPALVNGIRTFDAVEPKDDGCRYSVAFELDVKAGARLRPEFERKLRCAVTARFSRVRAILDSGEPIVAPTRGATPPVDPVS